MKIHMLLTTILAVTVSPLLAKPPATMKKPVTDTYYGVKVTEDYRWLENGTDPAVAKWSDAQNAYARSILDKLPHRDEIRARVTEIMEAKTVGYGSLAVRGQRLFAMKRQPPKQQRFLVVMPSADDPGSEHVVVDPNVINAKGTTAIDWYVPSADGTLVAVSLSEGGSEAGDVHVYDVAKGKEVFEVVPHVNGGTAGGDLAWAPDGSGFFYSRYPRGNERPKVDMDFYTQVYFHKLGTPTEADRYEIGKEFPRIAEIQLDMDRRTGRLLATVQNGDGGEFAHFLRSPDGKWRQFSRFGDRILQAAFGPHDDLYLISRADAPRGKVLHMAIGELDAAKARVVLPQGKDTIVSEFLGAPTLLPTQSKLYVLFQLGGPSEIRVFDLHGKPAAAPKQQAISSTGGLTSLGGDDVLFASTSYIEAPAWYRFDAKQGRTAKTKISMKSPVDFSDIRVVREFATSKDGTKVPVNIILSQSAQRNGKNPCVVTGYGGYGVNYVPRFRPANRVLLEQGIIYAVANLRGGGEYGEQWHLQGNLTKKQNVFDDFTAVLHHMIDRKYTSSNRLIITGGSNGGLLMGAVMTQHPDLMKAVVSHVGIYDMLRVELSPNGAFNVPEFGTVKIPEQFKALYAYSPYHHVKDGVKYPATLFLTGANDPRVDPMHSRKMTARLQAATASTEPILLRTSSSSGHGLDTGLDERIAQTVDVDVFMFDQLGIDYRPVTKR